MEELAIGRYRKIFEEQEAKNVARERWESVLPSFVTTQEIAAGLEILSSFEGCCVRADAILGHLVSVKPPPGFSLFM